MDNCEMISELLPEYVAGATGKAQNKEVARHIAACPACRADYALWVSLSRSLRRQDAEVPFVSLQTMLARLPAKETELERIIKTGSYTMAFDIIRYTFSTIKSTYRLAGLLTGGV